MINLVILGDGNVATQLAKTFYKSKNVNLVQVYARSKPSKFIVKSNIPFTNNIENLKDAQVYIIAISDDAISPFSKKLNLKGKLVVHTSGSVSVQDLQCNANKGVFYPLQSISKNKKISFKNIPLCIEARNTEDYNLLVKLAKTISNKVFSVNSKQRESLHVAAVFVNNFTNHLYKIGEDICTKNKVDFEVLKPLILETAKKIKHLSPKEAQTGPAVRNDQKTIQKHLKMLNKEQQEIYSLLTNSIIKDNTN